LIFQVFYLPKLPKCAPGGSTLRKEIIVYL
jgi:hypothetical protein